MKCSNLTRCDKPSLTYFENIYIRQNCNGIYEKGTKYIKGILIKCCNNQNVNKKYNILFVTIVSNFVCINVIYNFSKYVKFRN